jgi:hypothetical protein
MPRILAAAFTMFRWTIGASLKFRFLAVAAS